MVLALPDKLAVTIFALKFPLLSLFTKVLGVLFAVADAISLAMVVMVEELTPPTLITLGKSPVPPKSPVNCTIPFELTDASGAAPLAILESTNAAVAIWVLFASLSGVVAVGDPVKEGDEIVGDTIVLFVKVSAPVKVARVPVVGKVIFVEPILVKVVLKLPAVVKVFAVTILPPKVIVLPVLSTPVPPYCPVIGPVKAAVPSKSLPYILLAVFNCVVVLALPAKLPVTFPVTLPKTSPDKEAVIVPALKLPLASLLTNLLAVLVDVAAVIVASIAVIVEAVTPPTLFTVGASAVPPKSLVNFNIPFVPEFASTTVFDKLAWTNAVVAICVSLVPLEAVGACGIPVKVGEAKFAFKSNAF